MSIEAKFKGPALSLADDDSIQTQLKKIPQAKWQNAAKEALNEQDYQFYQQLSQDQNLLSREKREYLDLRHRIYKHIWNHAQEYVGISLVTWQYFAKEFLNSYTYKLFGDYTCQIVAGYVLEQNVLSWLGSCENYVKSRVESYRKQPLDTHWKIQAKQQAKVKPVCLGTKEILARLGSHKNSINHKNERLCVFKEYKCIETEKLIQSKAFKRILHEAKDEYFERFLYAKHALINPNFYMMYSELSKKQLVLLENEEELADDEYNALLKLESIIDTYKDHNERFASLEQRIADGDISFDTVLSDYRKVIIGQMNLLNKNQELSEVFAKRLDILIEQIDSLLQSRSDNQPDEVLIWRYSH